MATHTNPVPLNAETAGTANTYENPNINTATSHTTTAGEVPAAHATSRAATSTVGGGDAPTTRSGGIGQQIKGAFAQGHVSSSRRLCLPGKMGECSGFTILMTGL